MRRTRLETSVIDSAQATRWIVLLGLIAWLACGKTSSGGTGGGGAAGSARVGTGGVTVARGGTSGATSGGAGGRASGGASGSTTVSRVIATGGASGGTGGTSTGTAWPVLGGPCAVPGEQSACAHVDADPCLSCQGHWLYCANGTWRETHRDPIIESGRPVDPGPDATVVDQAFEAMPIETGAETAIDGPSVLRGYLVYANEVMAFEACGTTNLSWANLQGWEKGLDLLPDLGPFCVITDGGRAPCPGTIYVELVGTVSACERCGNMGRYRQELRVGAFLAASLTGPADCPFLPPVFPG